MPRKWQIDLSSTGLWGRNTQVSNSYTFAAASDINIENWYFKKIKCKNLQIHFDTTVPCTEYVTSEEKHYSLLSTK